MSMSNYFITCILTSWHRHLELRYRLYKIHHDFWSHGVVLEFEVKFGLFYQIYVVKGKEISIFLQIWIRKYVYVWNITCTWSDTIRPCQHIHQNAPGRGVKFNISRIPLRGLETSLGWRYRKKILQNPNLNEVISYVEFE